jgi:hypothetical protein
MTAVASEGDLILFNLSPRWGTFDGEILDFYVGESGKIVFDVQTELYGRVACPEDRITFNYGPRS